MLANVGSRLIPAGGFFSNYFSIELMFCPSIPNNIVNWCVFDYGEEIIDFLVFKDKFQDFMIDEITRNENLCDFSVINSPHSISDAYKR